MFEYDLNFVVMDVNDYSLFEKCYCKYVECFGLDFEVYKVLVYRVWECCLNVIDIMKMFVVKVCEWGILMLSYDDM